MSPTITVSVVLGLLAYAGAVHLWRAYKKHRDDYRQGYLLRVRYEAAVDTVQLLNHWYNLEPKGPEEDALAAEVLEFLAQRDAEALAQRATTGAKPGSWT
ncbi:MULTISPECIES: hypothetical protein [Pseudomonas]|uniref:hypothetical protein n=1 Tax=Pseudomonas TaxID=286 RepID=UPI001474D863|nr:MULTISPECIES: hypothetical protein [Pseudomonas]MCU0209139.1 hypothetical protein [Pseudomonas shahriarae]NMY19000.1 hypothetical protein [Pseudomonas sp. WS 5410]